MSIASTFEHFDRQKVLCDHETLQAMFWDAVKDNPYLAEQLAWLLYRVIREMAEGKKGRNRVVNSMKLGVDWLYQYTDAHKVSFNAFLYVLEGMVPSDPQQIVRPTIKSAEPRFVGPAASGTAASGVAASGVPSGARLTARVLEAKETRDE